MEILMSGKLTEHRLTAMVNYDDPNHRQIHGEQYNSVDGILRLKHFPVQGNGQLEVVYDYLEYNYEPTTEEVLRDVALLSDDIRLPDFAETKDFDKEHPFRRRRFSIISFCGHGDDRCPVVYVRASDNGLHLNWAGFINRWPSFYRFLVVRIK